MSHTGTLRTARATSSTDEAKKTVTIDLKAPTSWKEMSQEQLRYVLELLSKQYNHTVIKTYMFVYFCDIHLLKKTRFGWKFWVMDDDVKRIIYLPIGHIRNFIKQFDFIDQLEDMDCRLDAVCGLHAADVHLQKDVTFEEYLYAEKYYQIFIETKDMEWLDNVAMWLYRDSHGRAAGHGDAVDDNGKTIEEMTLTPGERTGTMLWYDHVKREMSKAFPHFFKKVEPDEDGEPRHVNFIELYNIQLRALTGGDATKEREVLQLDCWRALTELDAKARESEELEKIKKSH